MFFVDSLCLIQSIVIDVISCQVIVFSLSLSQSSPHIPTGAFNI